MCSRVCNHYGPCNWWCHRPCHCQPFCVPAPVVVYPPPVVVVRPRPLRARLHTETRIAIKALSGRRG